MFIHKAFEFNLAAPGFQDLREIFRAGKKVMKGICRTSARTLTIRFLCGEALDGVTVTIHGDGTQQAYSNLCHMAGISPQDTAMLLAELVELMIWSGGNWDAGDLIGNLSEFRLQLNLTRL